MDVADGGFKKNDGSSHHGRIKKGLPEISTHSAMRKDGMFGFYTTFRICRRKDVLSNRGLNPTVGGTFEHSHTPNAFLTQYS